LDLLETILIKVLGSLTICWASFKYSSLTAVGMNGFSSELDQKDLIKNN
jgi:hypothetical protein